VKRNSFSMGIVAYLAQKTGLVPIKELNSSKGLTKIRLLRKIEEELFKVRLKVPRPMWWSLDSVLTESLTVYGEGAEAASFEDFIFQNYYRKHKNRFSRELVGQALHTVGPWNPDFLNSLRDPEVISYLN